MLSFIVELCPNILMLLLIAVLVVLSVCNCSGILRIKGEQEQLSVLALTEEQSDITGSLISIRFDQIFYTLHLCYTK